MPVPKPGPRLHQKHLYPQRHQSPALGVHGRRGQALADRVVHTALALQFSRAFHWRGWPQFWRPVVFTAIW